MHFLFLRCIFRGMKDSSIRVLLADDDIDDCLLFQDALTELELTEKTTLATAKDGDQLMRTLLDENRIPDVLFLDLNMPRKNGFECLVSIMSNNTTKDIPVIIFSTSFNPDIVKLLHAKGARRYIRKPEDFESLKSVIKKGLSAIEDVEPIPFNRFVVNA